MNRIVILAVISLANLAASAQLKLQPGYFITNDGQRTECTIRHFGFSNNPSEVQYVLGEGPFKSMKMEEVKEFGVTDGPTFFRYTVDIDRSPDISNRLSNDRAPKFKQETLYLRKLVAGKANLYEYFDGIRRYFYAMDNTSVPQQLVYKRYLPIAKEGYQSNYAVTNDTYKQQLLNDLKCESILVKDIENLKYERKPLVALVKRYNDCTVGIMTSAVVEESTTRLVLRPGVGFNKTSVSNGSVPFDDAMSYRVGMEVEIYLKDPKREWAFPVEFAYESFNTTSNPPGYTVDYKAFTLSAGPRKYFPLSENSKFFVNAIAVYALPAFTDSFRYPTSGYESSDIGSGFNLRFGGGYKIGKFTLEAAYSLDRKMKLKPTTSEISYGGFSIYLGYYLK